jgi:hypothetical protein
MAASRIRGPARFRGEGQPEKEGEQMTSARDRRPKHDHPMRRNGDQAHAEHRPPIGSVTLRRLEGADAEALERLADLDSATPPGGRLLGAEVEGVLLAAISLDTGELVSDPFSRTGELRAMLELRAAQLGRRTRFQRLAFRTRPRAALAGSPPGAGGRLLTLLPRA